MLELRRSGLPLMLFDQDYTARLTLPGHTTEDIIFQCIGDFTMIGTFDGDIIPWPPYSSLAARSGTT